MHIYRLFSVSLVMIFMMTACSSPTLFDRKPPDRTEPLSIPQYPNAKNEQYSTKPSIPGFDDQFLEFQTDDSVDEVVAFYETYFETNKWRNIVAGDVNNPNSDRHRAYALHASNAEACPIYDFYSTIKEVNESETYAEMKLISLTCSLR